MNDLVANPFTNTKESTSLQEMGSSREAAEVQAMVFMAKKFPRDQVAAMDRILLACQRPTLAEQSLYSYSRGGTDITGPSIRLAEALAQSWGNLDFGVKELEQRSGESTVEAYAWDIETNTRQRKIFQVSHTRHTKRGSYNLSDPRDIYEAVANQAARRLRACILAVIPGDVIDAAVRQCDETLKAKADTSPAAMAKMVEAFMTYKITKEQLEKRIQRRLDAITPAQVIGLRKIYNSLKDGMSSPGDWFEVETESPAASVTETLKKKVKKEPQIVFAPGPCPEGGPMAGDVPTESICAKCPQRDECPTWPPKE